MLNTRAQIWIRAVGMLGAVILIWCGGAPSGEAAAASAPYSCHVEMAPMRDGVKLSTQVFVPSGNARRFPVVMWRLPYSNSIGAGAWMKKCALPSDLVASTILPFVTHGYVFLVQDVRGTGDSQGVFHPWFQEQDDGYDAVEWAAAQPWSNGRVGLTGISYMGRTGLQGALAQPPHLVAVVAGFTPGDSHDNSQYENGVFCLSGDMFWSHLLGRDAYWRQLRAQGVPADQAQARASAWADSTQDVKDGWPTAKASWINYLPIAQLPQLKSLTPFYYEWLAHPIYSSYWATVDVDAHISRIKVPVTLMGGWYDDYGLSIIRLFEGVRAKGGSELARRDVKLIMKPICHGACAKGSVTFGSSDTDMLQAARQIPWWDHWMKGVDNGAEREPAVKLYVMSPPDSGTDGSGFWINANQYPLPGTEQVRFNLRSGGHASTTAGDGVLDSAHAASGSSDRFTYDPSNPVPTVSDLGWDNGPLDQRPVENRDDVLIYTSRALPKDIAVVGPVHLTFWAKTSARDTDFTAKLVDVHPDGYAQNVMDRIVDARLRHGSKLPPAAVTPGKAYRYELYLGETATIFKKGHKIRLEISSSDFPNFARNLNTGGDVPEERTPVIAHQTILHDMKHPSDLQLSVVPGIQTYRAH